VLCKYKTINQNCKAQIRIYNKLIAIKVKIMPTCVSQCKCAEEMCKDALNFNVRLNYPSTTVNVYILLYLFEFVVAS